MIALLSEPDADYVLDALKIAFNLATVDENRAQFRTMGGIPFVIHALRTADEQLQRQAIKTLYALSIDGKFFCEVIKSLTHQMRTKSRLAVKMESSLSWIV